MAKKAKRQSAANAFRCKQVRMEARPLEGLCPETTELLKDRNVFFHTLVKLKQLLPTRQIEVARLMIAMNNYSSRFVASLLKATPSDQFVNGATRYIKGLTAERTAMMKQEAAKLDREFRLMEHSYGDDHLDLVVAVGYVRRLLENARVARYLAQNFSELLSEFQKIAESHKVTA